MNRYVDRIDREDRGDTYLNTVSLQSRDDTLALMREPEITLSLH